MTHTPKTETVVQCCWICKAYRPYEDNSGYRCLMEWIELDEFDDMDCKGEDFQLKKGLT